MSVSATFANRLMISVRRHYYGHEHDVCDLTISSVRFADMGTRDTTNATSGPTMAGHDIPRDMLTATAADSGEYEMQEFSERRGF